jgi:hypothetical protein
MPVGGSDSAAARTQSVIVMIAMSPKEVLDAEQSGASIPAISLLGRVGATAGVPGGGLPLIPREQRKALLRSCYAVRGAYPSEPSAFLLVWRSLRA